MEKGILSKMSQEALNAILLNLVKDEKPAVRLLVVIGSRVAFLVGDDVFAEKLPEDLKVKARQFFDLLLVEKDYDGALILGIELAPLVYALFKKKDA